MAWLGQGTPAFLQGFVPGSNPANPAYNSQQSEGLSVTQAQIEAQKKQQESQQAFTGGQNAAERAQRSGELAAQLGYQGTEAGLQRTFEGQQAEAQRGFQGQQNEAQRGSEQKIAQMPWDYKNKVFGTVSPLLQQLLGPGGAGTGNFSQGGAVPPPPPMSNATVYSPDQINEQVNAAKAGTAATAATQNRDTANRLASQGFGAHSPLLAALQNQQQMAAMASGADTERQLRFDAANANAKQGVDVSKVQAQNYATQADALSRQRQANLNYSSSLVAALSGMI